VVLFWQPELLWSKGFVLSAMGALGVILSGECFAKEQLIQRSLWLLLWFVPLIAFFFFNFVGTWFWLQLGMGWIWDQIFLPVLFLVGLFFIFSPQTWALELAKGTQRFLEIWLSWESRDLISRPFLVYRPRVWEVGLFLGCLAALACWNQCLYMKRQK
jgi:hypothetical protein